MASFGRRPAKGSADGRRHVAQQPTLGRASGGSFRSMKEEEELRLQFKKEHQQRQEDKEDEPAAKSPLQSKARHEGPNPKIFLEVEIRHKLTGKLQASGRLEFELLADKVPLTAENFRCLCTGEKARDLHYENCIFHSITPGVKACGGDITAGNGTGGRSIYGESFSAESCSLRHNAAGLLSMATLQSNTHNSQFFLMLGRAEHMDRKHVVFGRMTDDDENMLKHIDKAGSKAEASTAMVSIVDCGEVGKSRPVRDRSRSPKAGGRVPLDKDGRVHYGRMRSSRRQ
eukprot:TRINITY_DN96137_c0_g1_i1.p1 TRINITY_DN96137_c0_g1~~TRINITY_DN96137_c0_g1_i1.p1  ORF type:complete len:286 (-),score=43.39 TRINITY_DN96137_c0_g1_i1:9-866(-)